MKKPLIATAVTLAIFAGFAPFAHPDGIYNRLGTTASIAAERPADALSATAEFVVERTSDKVQTIQAAMGVETGESPIDFDALVRFAEDKIAVFGPSVSREVEQVRYVKKIEFGRQSEVRVVTTSSGVYSTDALASDHVLYPDVEVRNVPRRGDGRGYGTLDGRRVWRQMLFPDAGSFVTLGEMPSGGRYMTDGTNTCFVTPSYRGCV